MSARLAVFSSLLVTMGGGAQSAAASRESEWSFVKGACVYRHLLFPNGANFTFRNPCEMVICDARNRRVYFKRCPAVNCPHCDSFCHLVSLKGSYPHCCQQVVCDRDHAFTLT
ncbi:complement inhibitor CirpT1-like [Dermacentor albipictus]|uniref:complement inhibitor CirpT1-like n=1 Tax=Dermacentor albipictus TaxID=60249 RepID=UPI0031FBF2DE